MLQIFFHICKIKTPKKVQIYVQSSLIHLEIEVETDNINTMNHDETP